MQKLRILLLAYVVPAHPATMHDHLAALSEMSVHDVFVHCPATERDWAPPLHEFDVVMLHYSLMIWSDNYLPAYYHDKIAAFRGLKVLFIQDEYREVHAAMDMMERLGVDLLFTCVPARGVEAAYGELKRRGVRIEQTLTGYVPISFDESAVVPMADRPLDVIYRAREVPFALGRLAQEKFEIATTFSKRAGAAGLRYDISCREADRIYGDDWIRFLASSRTSLGTESGASIMDFTGDIDRAVKRYLEENPGAGFGEVHENVLAPYEGNVVINVISPRAFEAIFLRNVLVLYTGEYSNILVPDRHYIALEKDYSNFEEVAERIRDVRFLEEMAGRAYGEIIASGRWSYAAFVRSTDAILAEEWSRRVRRPPVPSPLGAPSPAAETCAAPSRNEWRDRLRAKSVRAPESAPLVVRTTETAPLAEPQDVDDTSGPDLAAVPVPDAASPRAGDIVIPRSPALRLLQWAGSRVVSAAYRRRISLRFVVD